MRAPTQILISLCVAVVCLALAAGSDCSDADGGIATVRFDGNGGSPAPFGSSGVPGVPDQRVLIGNAITLPCTGFGYAEWVGGVNHDKHLVGWSESPLPHILRGSASRPPYIPCGANYAVTGDATLYAVWEEYPEWYDYQAPRTASVGELYEFTPFSPAGVNGAWEHDDAWAYLSHGYNVSMNGSVPQWLEWSVSGGETPTATFSGRPTSAGVHTVIFTFSAVLSNEREFSIVWTVNVSPADEGVLHPVGFSAGAEGCDGQPAGLAAYGMNAVTLPSDGFSRDGYTLAGWDIPVDGTPATFPLGSVYTVRGGVSAVAHWIPDAHAVVFDANGGVAAPGSAPAFAAYTGEVASLPSGGYSMHGHALAGWSLESDPSSVFAPGYLLDVAGGTMVLKACWIPEGSGCTVAFSAGGGDGATVTQTVGQGMSVVLPAHGFTREGFEFKGWRSSADGPLMPPGSSVAVVGGESFLAQWEEIPDIPGETPAVVFTVVFDLDGGSGSAPVAQVEAGDRVPLPPRPERAMHVFQGWREVGGSGWWDFSRPVTGDMTLRAAWEEHFAVSTDGLSATVALSPGFAGRFTLIMWGDGSQSEGYGAFFTHEFRNAATYTLAVLSNGALSAIISERSSATVAVEPSGDASGQGAQNPRNADPRDGGSNVLIDIPRETPDIPIWGVTAIIAAVGGILIFRRFI